MRFAPCIISNLIQYSAGLIDKLPQEYKVLLSAFLAFFASQRHETMDAISIIISHSYPNDLQDF